MRRRDAPVVSDKSHKKKRPFECQLRGSGTQARNGSKINDYNTSLTSRVREAENKSEIIFFSHFQPIDFFFVDLFEINH